MYSVILTAVLAGTQGQAPCPPPNGYPYSRTNPYTYEDYQKNPFDCSGSGYSNPFRGFTNPFTVSDPTNYGGYGSYGGYGTMGNGTYGTYAQYGTYGTYSYPYAQPLPPPPAGRPTNVPPPPPPLPPPPSPFRPW